MADYFIFSKKMQISFGLFRLNMPFSPRASRSISLKVVLVVVVVVVLVVLVVVTNYKNLKIQLENYKKVKMAHFTMCTTCIRSQKFKLELSER